MSERKVKREGPIRHATDAEVLAASRKLTRRSFAVAAIGAAAGFGLYRWVDCSRNDGMQPIPRRRAFQANAALSRKVFDERAIAPTYPINRAENLHQRPDRDQGSHPARELAPATSRCGEREKFRAVCTRCYGVDLRVFARE
jgi:hypothetical protein